MVVTKMKNAASASYEQILPKEVIEVFHKNFTKFSNVQIRAGSELLSYNDVVVESPTGSGKTLAFLIPIFTILKKKGQFGKNEIGALILSPSRELCNQIATVATPYADTLGYTISMAVGGPKVDQNLKKLKNSTCDILVATPGRLYQLLQLDKSDDIRKRLKSVEILVVDEADRFNESQFEVHVKEILAAVPKQKRTGLFSATQAKENSDLSIFALRNAKHIKLKEAENVICPVALNNFYTICEAAEKVMCTVEFIRSKPDKKILVFFPSCGGVRYFKTIFDHVVTKRPLLSVHGKNTQKQRTDQIGKFRESTNAVILSTDVMSRGIDIEDIDWVVQFEIPKLSSWFVHRAGRTGRNGREGNSLLILTPQQTAYSGFVTKHEKVEFKELKVPTNNADKAEQLRQKIIKIACSDRAALEQGTRAFVSHIESYVKHDCNVVCGLKDLDVPGIAMAYGLLRLPKMRELGQRTDLDKFMRSDIDTSTIAYANPAMEKNRPKVMEEKHQKKVDVKKQKLAEKREKEREKAKRNKNRPDSKEVDPKKAKSLKRKVDKEEREEHNEFEADVRLLKKMKKGRLSAKEMKDIKF